MNGAIFFVCLTSWLSPCSPAATFVQLKRRPSRRREFKKGRQEKSLRKQNRGLLVWFQETCWTRSNPRPQVRMLPMARENPQLDSESQEIATRQKSKPGNEFSKEEWRHSESRTFRGIAMRNLQETATTCWKSTWQDQVRQPQHANLRLSIRWQSLREFATKITSQMLHTRCGDQHIHLGFIHVHNDEIISSSWTSIPREFGSIHEYQLRGAQDVVRCNVEIDRGTVIQDSECIYDDIHSLALDEIYLLCVMIKRSNGRKQMCMSTQIQSCVWERCIIIQKWMKIG